MTRVRYFDGQLLSAEDFADEQAYHINKRRLLNLRLLGAGVVDGLNVSVDTPSAVVVTPGLAIDSRGNEILVECSVLLDIGSHQDPFFVTIEYTETPSAPVPTPTGGTEFSRITEGFQISLTPTDPSDEPNASGLALAKLIRQLGDWIVDPDYEPPRAGPPPCRPITCESL